MTIIMISARVFVSEPLLLEELICPCNTNSYVTLDFPFQWPDKDSYLLEPAVPPTAP